mmetsp:Transcript_25948/g.62943  ORF Transcript_25948/g.62943 Transcript_25948/m.62943 type:complete len:389 (-) Transcript_25948:67-1233(-)
MCVVPLADLGRVDDLVGRQHLLPLVHVPPHVGVHPPRRRAVRVLDVGTGAVWPEAQRSVVPSVVGYRGGRLQGGCPEAALAPVVENALACNVLQPEELVLGEPEDVLLAAPLPHPQAVPFDKAVHVAEGAHGCVDFAHLVDEGSRNQRLVVGSLPNVVADGEVHRDLLRDELGGDDARGVEEVEALDAHPLHVLGDACFVGTLDLCLPREPVEDAALPHIREPDGRHADVARHHPARLPPVVDLLAGLQDLALEKVDPLPPRLAVYEHRWNLERVAEVRLPHAHRRPGGHIHLVQCDDALAVPVLEPRINHWMGSARRDPRVPNLHNDINTRKHVLKSLFGLGDVPRVPGDAGLPLPSPKLLRHSQQQLVFILSSLRQLVPPILLTHA